MGVGAAHCLSNSECRQRGVGRVVLACVWGGGPQEAAQAARAAGAGLLAPLLSRQAHKSQGGEGGRQAPGTQRARGAGWVSQPSSMLAVRAVTRGAGTRDPGRQAGPASRPASLRQRQRRRRRRRRPHLRCAGWQPEWELCDGLGQRLDRNQAGQDGQGGAAAWVGGGRQRIEGALGAWLV